MIMEDFSSSSSSSSSEGDQLFRVFLPEVVQHDQKTELYVENIVPQYTEKQFIWHFKVPKPIILNLAMEFDNSEYYPKTDSGFERIPAEKCMLIFCWYATHEAVAYRDVADRFNISISTLHLIIANVSYFLSNKSNDVITWPTDEEKREILQDFVERGFPDAVGCLDGTHIRIDKPEQDPESYINRKKFYSIQTQAVCDSKKRIIDVFIGWPGSVHDARVFANSSLSRSLANKCEDKFILADSAYPCLRHLLTPYRDNGNLNATERNFNHRLSQSRILIEHTFGLLKQRFRQLYHLKLRSTELICHFIRACCVLHNLIYKEPQAEDLEIVNLNENLEDDGIPEHIEDNQNGHNFRNFIAARMYLEYQ